MTAENPKESRSSAVELFWLSFMTLFVELLAIRWLSSDLRAFTVLKSFPLAACFVGMGLGSAVSAEKYYKWTPPLLLVFCLVTRLLGESPFGLAPFPSNSTFSWLAVDASTAGNGGYILYLLTFMVLVLVSLAGPFLVCFTMGNRLGILFGQSRPLKAYSVNLLGALLGSVVFTIGSIFCLSPALLLIAPAILLCYYLKKESARFRIAAIVCLVLIGLGNFIPERSNSILTVWSPYERIDMVPLRVEGAVKTSSDKTSLDKTNSDRANSNKNVPPIESEATLSNARPLDNSIAPLENNGEPLSLRPGDVYSYLLLANKVGQQGVMRFTEDEIKKSNLPPEIMLKETTSFATHRLPFMIKQPAGEVLTVACGLGNDVAAALAAGATRVDAVEIDPVTLELGRKYNPEKPYQSPKVNAVCDDARHFISRCDKKYDIVRFAFLDSMTVLSQSSTSRLDNFVYTRESIASALKLLKPDGVFFLSFFADKPWFIDRLYWTIEEAAGYKPLAFTYDIDDEKKRKNVFFVLGEGVKNGTLKLPETMPKRLPGDFALLDSVPKPARILTDDWPYIYFAPTGFDFGYFAIVLEVLAVAALTGRKVLMAKRDGTVWQLFFMGGAFMLLELQSISRLALLYGTTWKTSSIVISGILIMLVFANLFLLRHAQAVYAKLKLVYGLLFASIIVSYLLPVSQILAISSLPSFLTYLFVSAVTLLPILLAGLIFGSSFDRSKQPATALGYNLIGGVLGTLLEYCTSFLGIKNMVLVAGVLYLVSFYFACQAKPVAVAAEDAAAANKG